MGCFKKTIPEPVQLRRPDRSWTDSSIKRCPDCKLTFGGSLEDRIAYVRQVYDYKYFGDYELSPEQMDAVGEAIGMAGLLPELISILHIVAAELAPKRSFIDMPSRDSDIQYLRAKIADAIAAVERRGDD